MISTLSMQSPAQLSALHSATSVDFDMPAYGPTSAARVAVPASAAVAQVSTCARIRTDLIGDMGVGMGSATTARKGDFPGTSAWRPPSC